MKRILCVMIILFVSTSTLVFAETSKIMKKGNEYGGETKLITLSPRDDVYVRTGTAKSIEYYDSSGKTMKAEYVFTGEHARKDGIAKSISYIGSNRKEEKREFFYTDEHARKDGVAKSIVYIGSNGKMVNAEKYGKDGVLLK